jgi:anti-sigma factor RsiW
MKEIACTSGVELLIDYLEGVLSPELRSALEAHVAGCPRCVAFIASYRETPRILRDATEATLPPGLQSSLRDFLRAQRGVPPAEH